MEEEIDAHKQCISKIKENNRKFQTRLDLWKLQNERLYCISWVLSVLTFFHWTPH